ncbi:hypothetical protein EV421DRAFT_1735247 [Armillaria borealis]|uniref:Uncharacterized protein n=1 Tax=Armillaria borealis TaxID=47425 RepID=A0AA39MSS3_9AGAR|nr:hypothetical protein EV421DRAFT_1735247 [Armillaria borealis]
MSYTTTRKRKSDASSDAAAKKTRLNLTADKVIAILADSKNYPVPEDSEASRAVFVELSQYARNLEEEIAGSKPKARTPEQVNAAAEKLKSAARSGIKKQMTWKTSCKTGSSKWMYDGVCNDGEVFGAMLGLDEEFQSVVGDIEGSARYNTLYMRGNVNIHWKPDEGTFKFSGSYGV